DIGFDAGGCFCASERRTSELTKKLELQRGTRAQVSVQRTDANLGHTAGGFPARRRRYSLLPSTTGWTELFSITGCTGASFATCEAETGCSLTLARICSSLPKTSERFTGFKPATLSSTVPRPMPNS